MSENAPPSTAILPSLTAEQAVDLYQRLLRIRFFEEAALRLQSHGEILGALHTSTGQEGEIVGACSALRDDDYMVGNHRSHGHPIGKGASLNGLMAELMGRSTGVNGGKGGSMHLADFSVGSLGETSIVGSGFPIAVGAALGAKMKGTDRLCLCFFGDGASNEGTFHESLNLSAVWGLPVVWMCENNLYGSTTSFASVSALPDVASRASAYGIPGVIVDGQDVLAVRAAVSAAAERARAGLGPSLIEAKTYRYMDHAAGLSYVNDYRTQTELEHWKQRDPISLFRKHLLEVGLCEQEDLAGHESAVQEEVDAAVSFARGSSHPSMSALHEHLYSTLSSSQ